MRGAVVSCHAERLLDDRVWGALERLLARRPAGFVVTPLVRPPDPDAREDERVWAARAARAAELAPLGHHTHWGGPTRARPPGPEEPAARVRREAGVFRRAGLEPGFFCGGGWYMDAAVAEAVAELGYVDASATSYRLPYLDAGAPHVRLAGPARLRLAGGARLLELPATHSVGMLLRDLVRLRPLPDVVHVHFHDWDLVDPRRRPALEAGLRLLRLRRRPLRLDQLAAAARRDAPELELPPSAGR